MTLFLVGVAGLSGIGVLLFAVLYIRAASHLRTHLFTEYPTVSWDKPRSGQLVNRTASAWRLGGMVFLDHPVLNKGDLVFRRFVHAARLWMALWVASLLVLVIAVGLLFPGR